MAGVGTRGRQRAGLSRRLCLSAPLPTEIRSVSVTEWVGEKEKAWGHQKYLMARGNIRKVN